MKPTPTSNFSIWAYPAGLDEEGAPPALFEGAYGVRLNNTITVTFVPEYPRTADGWPAIDVPGGGTPDRPRFSRPGRGSRSALAT